MYRFRKTVDCVTQFASQNVYFEFQPKRQLSTVSDSAHEAYDKESEVNRLLSSLKLEDIRKRGIKCLPEEQYAKATVSLGICTDK